MLLENSNSIITVLTTNFYDHDSIPRMSADNDDDGEIIGADDDADMTEDDSDKDNAETGDDEDEA
ncbi:MAG: hypothetical protein WAP52_03300 [Candidatus Sungiibacteriota bacterium]